MEALPRPLADASDGGFASPARDWLTSSSERSVHGRATDSEDVTDHMVGALVISRAVAEADTSLSDEILTANAEQLHRL
ncbi:hypothetical protein [Curtobacterium sp. MCBD17_030]|uniref:hypothetical protein n=1 Tax=Curtobacterium sp. MCBD17_030 TaxID=2175649 RepID=UPI0015E8D8F6|nr:hypothetical protein [Curtobacterium sp. MCBD17_030]